MASLPLLQQSDCFKLHVVEIPLTDCYVLHNGVIRYMCFRSCTDVKWTVIQPNCLLDHLNFKIYVC